MQTMHLLPSVVIQPNLELKTQPKPVLGSLPLAFALPGPTCFGIVQYRGYLTGTTSSGKLVLEEPTYKQNFSLKD